MMVTIQQNLWDVAKGVLRGNFMDLNAYIQKGLKSATEDSTWT